MLKASSEKATATVRMPKEVIHATRQTIATAKATIGSAFKNRRHRAAQSSPQRMRVFML